MDKGTAKTDIFHFAIHRFWSFSYNNRPPDFNPWVSASFLRTEHVHLRLGACLTTNFEIPKWLLETQMRLHLCQAVGNKSHPGNRNGSPVPTQSGKSGYSDRLLAQVDSSSFSCGGTTA